MDQQPTTIELALPDIGLDDLYQIIGKLVVEKEQHARLVAQLVQQQHAGQSPTEPPA